ncbi:MAG: hypothetical protein VKJ02_11125 [Snowella sp.]|nr:hypothetical protein [Snowella sp.]
MKEQLEERLTQLKSEFEAGQKMMTELETKQSNLRDTLLRISGAIQILEEEINKVNEALEFEESAQETNVKIIN